MKTKTAVCLILAFSLLLGGCAPSSSFAAQVPDPDYWPTAGWQGSAPEKQGLDSNLLAQMVEDVNSNKASIHSILVVRNGYMVTEAYFHPYTRHTRIHIQSITKSIIGALTGIAIQKEIIRNADQPLLSFFQNRRVANLTDEKYAIQLKHLLSMSSGLDCAEFSADGPRMEQTADWVQFMLDLPVVAPPGETFGYCNGNAHLLSAILEKTSGASTREFANQELLQPLGIPGLEKADWGEDPQGYAIGGYGIHLRAVDLAKLAYLFLNNGQWEEQRILPENWVADSTTQHVQKEEGSGYGYLWTVYPESDHYAALGLGGQQIHVYPSKNLIVIVTAALESYAEAPEIERLLNEFILPAIKSDSALAENPEGVSRLQAALETAAHPVQPVAPLPATALGISGKVYTFEENLVNWKTLKFDFEKEADTAQLYLEGYPALEIGLDNIFRVSHGEPVGEILLRGRWEDEQTFIIDYPYPPEGPVVLGELGETEFRFKFTGTELEVMIKQLIFDDEPIVIKGSSK